MSSTKKTDNISFELKFSLPEHLRDTLVRDLASIRGIPSSVLQAFYSKIDTVMAVPPTHQSGYALALEGKNNEGRVGVRVYYGISGLPDIFRPATNTNSTKQLCVLRTSLVDRKTYSKGHSWKTVTEIYSTALYIYKAMFKLLCNYSKDTEVGQKELIALAREYYKLNPQSLYASAFLYHVFAEKVPLEKYIMNMQTASRESSTPSTQGSATFVLSPDKRIVVGRLGTYADTKRFLVAPEGQVVPLPEPGNAGSAPPLLPHQEKWLAKGDLARFQRACGVIPGKYSDWDPATMNSVTAQIVRNELLICGADLDR